MNSRSNETLSKNGKGFVYHNLDLCPLNEIGEEDGYVESVSPDPPPGGFKFRVPTYPQRNM